jgi:hypothetical protein
VRRSARSARDLRETSERTLAPVGFVDLSGPEYVSTESPGELNAARSSATTGRLSFGAACPGTAADDWLSHQVRTAVLRVKSSCLA